MRYFSAIVIFALHISALAQTSSQAVPTNDAQAVALAKQALATLTAGAAVSDVTFNANVISVLGSDYETGSGTFRAKVNGESRVDLALSGGTRTDVRSLSGGIPIGAWRQNAGPSVAYAQHNCWTDASWFFPPFSSLVQVANANFILKYVGLEQHNGVSVQHIQIFQFRANDGGTVQRLSTIEFYLDATTGLPFAIAFNAHDDHNMNVNVPSEIDFANYQSVNGILIPFHFQQLVNGVVMLDVTVTSAAFNQGLSDTLFSLQ